jgi:hypothetical protein
MLQMRARGFALRDAYPDVLKGLITAEEAQDFPAERDVTPARPANPLDLLKPVALPELPAEPAPPLESCAVDVEQVRDVVADRFALMVPGKDSPEGSYATVEEWEEAYEAMAERVANSKRWEPRTRMTKLRELKECNQPFIDEHGGPTLVANLQRGYQRRLSVLNVMAKGEA